MIGGSRDRPRHRPWKVSTIIINITNGLHLDLDCEPHRALRLQLELSTMVGRVEAPDIVAEKARLVYTVLELQYPQFPSDD